MAGSPATWHAVEKLSGDDEMYSFLAPPRLRVFLKVVRPGVLELFDILPEDAFRQFAYEGEAETGAV